jgi:hypothetical protein
MARLGSIFNLWVLNLKWHMKATFRQSKFLPDKLSEHRKKCLKIAPGRAETAALIPDHTALSQGIQVDQFSLFCKGSLCAGLAGAEQGHLLLPGQHTWPS